MKKKLCVYLLVFSCILIIQLKGQNNTGVIEGSVNSKNETLTLQGVNIYLEGSTRSTISDEDGKFVIQSIPVGDYSLVAELKGYKEFSNLIRINAGDTTKIRISLVKESLRLAESNVNTIMDENFETLLSKFSRILIGSTSLAENTELINPEVLNISENQKGILTATCSDRLRIRNKDLGYILHADLKKFKWSLRSDIGSVQLSLFFTEMESDDEDQLEEWQENREECYKGSLKHFLSALVSGDLYDKGYVINYKGRTNIENRLIVFHSDEHTNELAKELYQPIADGIYEFYSDRDIEIIYTEEADSEYYYFQKMRKIKEYNPEYYQISKINFKNGPLCFDKSGDYTDINMTLNMNGYLAWKRLADQLPRDYSGMK